MPIKDFNQIIIATTFYDCPNNNVAHFKMREIYHTSSNIKLLT